MAALAGVSLSLRRGEQVALLGPSGSGKSTLLSIIAGFDVPTSGQVFFAGIDIASRPAWRWVGREIGFLFQSLHLVGWLSPLENVELALIPTTSDAGVRRARSRDLLERAGLGARLDIPVRDLSGGERQRVAFCRAIANRPELLLADEPTGALDSHSKQQLLDLMRDRLATDGAALLVATHDQEVAAICDRVVRLRDGRIEP